VNIIEKFHFVDYIRNGWTMRMSVAIDFTASNGEYFEQCSLHKISASDNEKNVYERAIE
jgi:hypothetical protein